MGIMKDPFNEHGASAGRRRLHLLGGIFEFESNSRRLLHLVDGAYAGLKRHRLAAPPRFRIRLQLTAGQRFTGNDEPPALHVQAGTELICGAMDAANFVALCPQTRTGLVAISRELLQRFPYHARYELLEFAVFTLASRAQGLAPLHAGCVGFRGSAVLLIGASGAGKSTLALQCMLQGLDFVAEDAVFVAPKTLLATGIANFLHLREDSLRLLAPAVARRLRRSPVIRRRSGVEKFEIDLRGGDSRVAQRALPIAGVIFVSKQHAKGDALLVPLSPGECLKRLEKSQEYAAGLPGWAQFARQICAVGAFELRRGREAHEGAAVLRGLLEWGQSGR